MDAKEIIIESPADIIMTAKIIQEHILFKCQVDLERRNIIVLLNLALL